MEPCVRCAITIKPRRFLNKSPLRIVHLHRHYPQHRIKIIRVLTENTPWSTSHSTPHNKRHCLLNGSLRASDFPQKKRAILRRYPGLAFQPKTPFVVTVCSFELFKCHLLSRAKKHLPQDTQILWREPVGIGSTVLLGPGSEKMKPDLRSRSIRQRGYRMPFENYDPEED